MNQVEQQLRHIKELIHKYEEKYSRSEGSVHLLAASKSQSIANLIAAYEAGQRLFGENYVKEALDKIAALHDQTIEWHFIGRIQKNKTRKIAEHFAWVHSVPDIKIAQRLNDQRPVHLPPLNICIEVNVSEEKSKFGCHSSDILPLVEFCAALPRINLRGLMAIPAPHDNFTEQRKEFHKLKCIQQSLIAKGFALDTLSIGMSDDFEAAIAEGSTLVRIGTSIFGQRP